MPHPTKATDIMNAPSVTAIVVNYNVRELLLACLQALQDSCAAGHLQRIVVVDSASTDGSSQVVREQFPDVEVIDAPNRGYGAGANLGMQSTQSDYVLILNPDTVVPPQTILGLTNYLHNNPNVGVCAPRLRYPDGRLQPSRRRFPRRLTPVFESTIFQKWWPSNRWSRHYYLRDRAEGVPQEVDWVVGACLLVRRGAIDRAGMFDESFWMYCEEIEWCWRIQHHGWRVAYMPDVEIVHYEGASTKQDVPMRQLAFDRSRVELQRRLYGSQTALAVQAGIRLSYVLQVSVEGAKWLLGHRRDLRRERIAFYRSLLFSSMRFNEDKH